MLNKIEEILEPFQKFGINLGLERIKNLLNLLDNPQNQVPIIHVGGTNGKGSVCAYLSSVLTQAGYKTGRYTSPHLIDWTERICIDEKPIEQRELIEILTQISKVIENDRGETPTQFEIITAAAWLYFARMNVDVVVMEVGLGGRLDATNVCDRCIASVITSIGRDHWQRLGDTLAKIAFEKAGIIKPSSAVIVGQLPTEAREVITQRAKKLNSPITWVKPATKITKNDRPWASYEGVEYPLALAGDIQLQNSALAIATVKILQQQGWKIDLSAIVRGMMNARWRGRIEWSEWQGTKLLIDGAHNVDAAKGLRQYTDTLNKQIIWVMGMLATKDCTGVFKELLKDNDRLYLVPVPDRSASIPEELATIARNINPHLEAVKTYPDLFAGLNEAVSDLDNQKQTIVICGSLYLLGYFLTHVNMD